jgi:hypothetical protein
MLAAKIPKQCCKSADTDCHDAACVGVGKPLAVSYRHLAGEKKNKWIFKPLSSFAPVTNLLVPSRAMGVSNHLIKVCHHFPTSITCWEIANLVCITNTDCRR